MFVKILFTFANKRYEFPHRKRKKFIRCPKNFFDRSPLNNRCRIVSSQQIDYLIKIRLKISLIV